jgi:hypothetical protein
MALINLKSKLSNFRSDFSHESKLTSPATIPGEVDFFIDKISGAKGFTSKASDRNKSNILGIQGSTYTSAVPGSTISNIGAVNFFNDVKSGAKGFQLNANDVNKSNFSGISGTTYNHPKLPFHILQVGNASLDNQLPEGSIFRYLKSGASSTKKFSEKGYNDKNKYGNVIQSIPGQSNKSLLYTRSTEKNSPSALDAEYKKFNLRDDAYNPGYMKHPLVLRDIGKRWGSPFDDGLIRGGMVTAVERAAMDTVRIAKWMASPKGLLWVVKQVGLGLTNPKVEATGGAFTRQTRIHSGITSLLSVAGTAFGLHFTRHGLPFLNAASSYENVLRVKQILSPTEPYSRLIKLKSEMLGFDSSVTGFKGSTINELSGLAGPGSVYGIGTTNIRRYTNSKDASIEAANRQEWNYKYYIKSQYASIISTNAWKSSASPDGSKYGGPEGSPRTAKAVDDASDSLNSKFINEFPDNSTDSPGTKQNDIRSKAENVDGRPDSFPKTGIKSYAVSAYNNLKRTATTIPQDFRNLVKEPSGDNKGKSFIGKPKDPKYYETYNLEEKYGFGALGIPQVDRSEPIGSGSFLAKETVFTTDKKPYTLRGGLNGKFRGDRVNATDITDQANLDEIYGAKAKDLIKFYFMDGVQGQNVMPFRCTMTGFSDSFSPSWNRIDIMGRPDGAYLYSSFERSVSFNFMAAAMSRSEMIPMWRKINYLATYTMPDFNGSAKPSGPMMRITIGDLFQETPGFITSLSYTIPDDATWDIAEDYSSTNRTPKQLPMAVEIAMSFQIIGDYRPGNMGRAYSLSHQGSNDGTGNWLNKV